MKTLFPALFASFMLSLGVHAQGWEHYKTKNGISVYYAQPDSLKVRVFKTEMALPTSAASVKKVINNAALGTQWINRTIVFEKLKGIPTTNDSVWYTYSEIELPWPLNNKDLVTENTLLQNDSVTHILIRSKPQLLPEKEGIKRIQHLESHWTITDRHNGAPIVYTVVSKDQNGLPQWLVAPILVGGLINTFENLRELLLKNEG